MSQEEPLHVAQAHGLRLHAGTIPTSAGIYPRICRSISAVVGTSLPRKWEGFNGQATPRYFFNSDLYFN